MGDEVSSKQSASVSRISLDLKKLLDAASPNVALKLILDVNPPPDLRNIIDRTPAVDGLISAHPGYEKERLKLIEYGRNMPLVCRRFINTSAGIRT